MLCLEILVNGERKYVAGHEQMEKMRASLYLTEADGPRIFVVNADFKQTETLSEDAFWPVLEPKVGDEIQIRILQNGTPNKPDRVVSRGKKENEHGEQILYCSFCGKSHHEVKKLITSKEVNVCDECFQLLGEIFNEA